MIDVIERLKRSTGPSRELDAEIFCALSTTEGIMPLPSSPGQIIISHYQAEYRTGITVVPEYTASIDAALTLVPEGRWRTSLDSDPDRGPLWRAHVRKSGNDWKDPALHNTPAIALCIAALKARKALDGE